MFAFSKHTLLVAVKREKSESKFLLSRTFWMCATSLTLVQKLEFDAKVVGPGLQFSIDTVLSCQFIQIKRKGERKRRER